MKKTLILFSALVLMFSFVPSADAATANSITNRLKGRLLLQVEKGGAIWYVNPTDAQKYQVTFANALSLFQKLALGITNADLIKIPADLDSINSNLDSDNDGYTDRAELQNGYSPYIPGSNKGRFKTDNNLAKKLKGKLLLQVEQGGAIWYVDVNGVRHSVRWDNLMDLFRRLALGISDKDLATVGNVSTLSWQTYKNDEYGFTLEFPQTWKGFTTNKKILNLGTLGTSNSIDFGFSTQDSLFNIGIYTKSQWQAIDSEEGLKPRYIAENSQYVFGYSNAQETFSEALSKRLMEAFSIINTFKFLDNRILLTPENIGQYNNPSKDPSSCNEKFNFDQANTTVTYSSNNKGISLKLPYNSSWGSSKYKFNPYDEYGSGLHFGLDKYDGYLNFGSMGVFEGCSWVRSYALGFLSAKSADEAITEMKDKDLMLLKPYKATINGLEVVKYEEGGMCSYPTILVIGEKYNYELRPVCGASGKFEALENIVKTIKFLD